eukprot:2965608-Prymnesium_polylepis.1
MPATSVCEPLHASSRRFQPRSTSPYQRRATTTCVLRRRARTQCCAAPTARGTPSAATEASVEPSEASVPPHRTHGCLHAACSRGLCAATVRIAALRAVATLEPERASFSNGGGRVALTATSWQR